MVSALFMGLVGGYLRRAYGGAVGWPRILRVLALCGTPAAVAWAMTDWLTALVVLVGHCLIWLPGHGSYMDMGRMAKPDNESLRWLLDRLFGPDVHPSEARDFTGMLLRYFIPCALLAYGLHWVGYPAVWPLLVAGQSVAVAYWVVSRLRMVLPHHTRWFDGFTAYGEFMAGVAVFWATFAII
jgi:hypothetical protein